MNVKALLTAIAFLAFCGFSIWWWLDKKKSCDCDNKINTASTSTPNNLNNLPLSFAWNSNTAINGNGFENYRNEQIKNLGPTDTLVINTWYYEGETNGAQLAMQRAEAIKALYPNLSADKIKIITEVKPSEEKLKKEKFAAASFSINANQKSLVKKEGNKITIYFASNASAKNVEKEIDDYLNTLVAEMKANPNETVTASGYTDNVGDDIKNLSLSQNRAEFVRTIMGQKGADTTKINAIGKGEIEPIATNDNEEGRKKNRRVELIINNK